MISIGIYKIINTINNKCYVGSSVNLAKRKSKHRFELDRGIHPNDHLQRAWTKYGGVKIFKFEVILECSKEKLIEQKQYYINVLCPEYNICRIAGNSLGRIPTQETRDKMSIAQTKRVVTNEFRKAVSKGCIGRTISDEQRRSIAKTLSIPVVKCDLDSNDIQEYSSIKEAVVNNNCNASNIINCMKKKPLKGRNGKVTYMRKVGGFKWRYKNESK